MASYTPGTYEGAARGYGGKLFVRVTVSEDRIEAVTVTQHKEYRGIAWGLNTTPIERYPELIVEYQSLNIPVVDGADLTCAAILDATAAALKAAGASKEDIAALRAAPAPKAPEYPDEVRTVDVVVCGAGAGGLAAAIEAKLAGADVVIVEKQGITGGATARSGGKLLGAGTRWQKKQGLFDTKDMVYDYLMDVGNRSGKFMDASKNRYLVDHLNQTLDWLTSIEATVKGDPVQVLAQPWEPLSKPVEKDGVLKTHFDVLDVEPIHVSLQPWRVHNSPGGGGQTNGEGGEISTPLTLYYENDLGGEIIYDTAMNEILTDEAGVVTGVTCTRKGGARLTLYARRGVILATGGYARNKDMVARYPVAHYFSNVPHGNVGDGLTAAEKLGARNFEHPAVQVVYTSMSGAISTRSATPSPAPAATAPGTSQAARSPTAACSMATRPLLPASPRIPARPPLRGWPRRWAATRRRCRRPMTATASWSNVASTRISASRLNSCTRSRAPSLSRCVCIRA